ncbi:MAG: hypothetical protein IT516_12260 [Burkholderiales bacterium]|nr:hypothetical protein [Burkholderiales bacterium]
MARNIENLREHLFDALDALKDGTMDVARAKAVSDIAQTIINSAKVEVDFMRARGDDRSTGFVPEAVEAPGAPDMPRLVRGKAQSGSR